MAKKEIGEKKEELKHKIEFSLYYNDFCILWAEKEMILEFAQGPQDDDGYLPAVRIVIRPEFINEIIRSLKSLKKDYEKMYGKIE